MPRSRIAETLEAANEICARHNVKVGHVFHAGDGNLHPSIVVNPADEAEIARVMKAGEEILEQVVLRDGANSGEHGIGIEKREAMALMLNTEPPVDSTVQRRPWSLRPWLTRRQMAPPTG